MKPSSSPSTNSFRAVALTAGFVLISAGLLKAGQPLGSSGGTAGHSPWTLVLLSFEAGLGLLLVLRPWLRPVQLTALLTFAVFSCVASYKAIIGLPSCGCFGQLHVPPIYTAGFDLLAVVGLASLPPERASPRWRRAGWVLAALTLVALAGMATGRDWIRSRTVARVDDAGGLTTARAGAIVLLEPETWTGKRLPILGHIDIGQRLAAGSWSMLLYHHDCPSCRETIAALEETAASAGGLTVPPIALIEMPPYAPPGESAVSPSSPFLFGKLSERHDWFATTPLAVTLRDGIVTSTAHGDDARRSLLNDAGRAP